MGGSNPWQNMLDEIWILLPSLPQRDDPDEKRREEDVSLINFHLFHPGGDGLLDRLVRPGIT
jgi:hypothetical protein